MGKFKSKYITDEQWIEAISTSLSYSEALRKLGLRDSGANFTLIHKHIDRLNIDTSHMTGKRWNQGERFKPFNKEIPFDEMFSKNTYHNTGALKRRLFREGLKEKRCECCGLNEWQGREIPLELHHIDGDKTNNSVENLQILCPNCHALTDNYRGKNIK